MTCTVGVIGELKLSLVDVAFFAQNSSVVQSGVVSNNNMRAFIDCRNGLQIIEMTSNVQPSVAGVVTV